MKLLPIAFMLCVLSPASITAARFASIVQTGASASEPQRAQPVAAPIDSQQSVKVSELPPLSIKKDWSDQSYWVFTFFLAIVGALQAYLLWGTMRVFERQALQMEHQTGILQQSVALAEKNAETAKQNIDMFMSRERAHLRLELLPLQMPLHAGPLKVSYKVALHGNSDAYVTGSCGRIDITDSSEPTDDSHWFPAMSIPQVVTPDQRTVEAQVQGVFPRPALEASEVEAIEAGRKFIHFRGFIKYNDVFGTERWTRSRRVWEVSQVRAADGSRQGHWSRRGSQKDNSET